MNLLIVGLDNYDSTILEDSVVLLKPDVFLNEEDKNEYCLKAFEMRNGVESGMVGHVAREFLSFRGCYENKLAQVIKLYSKSLNSYEKIVSAERNGVCICQIIS